jgi:hypothetical protein
LAALADKLEEEQAEVVKAQKQVKDMAVSRTSYLNVERIG